MLRFTLARSGSDIYVIRHAKGKPDHSYPYGAKLSGSSKCRRRQLRALAAQFSVTHGF